MGGDAKSRLERVREFKIGLIYMYLSIYIYTIVDAGIVTWQSLQELGTWVSMVFYESRRPGALIPFFLFTLICTYILAVVVLYR